MFISQLINTIQARKDNKKREITLVLDEFPELGKIENMGSALSTIRKYKTRIVLITQDLAQITEHYGKSQSIISNCGVRIAYAPNESTTAEMLSKDLGVTTYVAESSTTTVNKQPFQFLNTGGSISTSKQETLRPLMTADEVKTIGDKMIIQVEKKNPILGHKFAWFMSDKFKQRIFDVENPRNPGNKDYPPIMKSHRIVRKSKL